MEILSFNLITNMLNLKSGVMYALMGMFYLSFLVSIIEYIHILVFDPSDPRLSDKNYHDPSVEEKNCEICVSKVAASSHHCQSCQRCVEEFDHHCRFANNCVGKSNYSLFIRLLISIIIHTSSGIGISVWLALALTDAYRWVAVAYGVLNLIIFL
jgi:palmitoyltransferase